jgi:predicted porin
MKTKQKGVIPGAVTTCAALLLTATGVAFAEPSVTLSGGMAVGLKYQTAKSDKADGATVSIVNNQLSANNVTFKVDENLDGGLKASAYINVRFAPDTGANAATGGATNSFAQEVKLSLAGRFGEVAVGRFNAPVDNLVHPAVDPYIPLGLGTTVYGGPLDAVARYNGMIQYATPTAGGVSVRVLFVPKANMQTTVNTSELAVKYVAGPLALGLGYTKNAGDINGRTNFKGRDVITLGGLYDFGVAKVGLSYHHVDAYAAVAESDRASLGVRVPLTASTSLKFGYERQKSKGANAVNAAALGVDYYLSKRTMLSAELGQVTSDTLAKDDKGVNCVVGIKHTF